MAQSQLRDLHIARNHMKVREREGREQSGDTAVESDPSLNWELTEETKWELGNTGQGATRLRVGWGPSGDKNRGESS